MAPTNSPTVSPQPTTMPTKYPTANPTSRPSHSPSASPTSSPTDDPSSNPTDTPTMMPTMHPTMTPSLLPSDTPTKAPTDGPTPMASNSPSAAAELKALADAKSRTFPRTHQLSYGEPIRLFLNGTKSGAHRRADKATLDVPVENTDAISQHQPDVCSVFVTFLVSVSEPTPQCSTNSKSCADNIVETELNFYHTPSSSPSSEPSRITMAPSAAPTPTLHVDEKWTALAKSSIGSLNNKEDGEESAPFLTTLHIIIIASVGGGMVLLTASTASYLDLKDDEILVATMK
eukprot:CAMPEP_0185809212 /NCGR_PEP_ID=MMETSP1322-20130828/6069_1 /TAXON_ID=265543 /ORGANISM="Minutocellus polymorphus, Strain RCC2270" /LENGTH=287 /DNA_ID=CAMNT_0028505467 /DNA_START=208 /DNA_END=1069 /DNA_ORIENTATION=+